MERDPRQWIVDGYDVHLIYTDDRKAEAIALFERFMAYVEAERIPYLRPIVFEQPVGPWPTPMWQLLLRNQDPVALERDLGRCVAWMMLNRGGFSVMIHPNTRRDEGFGGGLRDHSRHMLWMGPSLPLKLDIFSS